MLGTPIALGSEPSIVNVIATFMVTVIATATITVSVTFTAHATATAAAPAPAAVIVPAAVTANVTVNLMVIVTPIVVLVSHSTEILRLVMGDSFTWSAPFSSAFRTDA